MGKKAEKSRRPNPASSHGLVSGSIGLRRSAANSPSCTKSPLEFNKFLGEMSQIQPLYFKLQANPPLLHRQGAEEHVDCFALFVIADFVDDISIGGNVVPFDSCHQKSRFWVGDELVSRRRLASKSRPSRMR
jgi:hypothetical protein